jgi:hypothetical protein
MRKTALRQLWASSRFIPVKSDLLIQYSQGEYRGFAAAGKLLFM